ncbi:hypothetical protein [Tenacibaculum halocynthiae]|uniref:hypothetical protein n=1 Tax=Tenacibaculum halocynthiae TaxID=1254437 RepID=UPI003D660117
MKYIIIMITCIFIVSCNKKTEVTDGFKISFLKKILKDTLIIKKNYLSQGICLSTVFPNLPNYIEEKGVLVKQASLDKYLSKVLEEDISFIKKQLKNHKSLDLNLLKEPNIKVIKNKKDNIDCLMIDNPIFNKRKDLAYIRFGVKSRGKAYLLQQKEKTWKVLRELDNWIE